MYEVNYSDRSWRSYVSNYFYCRIQPERLWYDAERDLLAIAKFLVIIPPKVGQSQVTHIVHTLY